MATNHDVILAKQLAEIAQIKLYHKDRAELPPEDFAQLEKSITTGIAWQGPFLFAHKYKSFRVEDGCVNVMGHDGIIIRNNFAAGIAKSQTSGATPAEKLLNYLLSRSPQMLKRKYFDATRSALNEIIYLARDYVDETKLYNFFSLYELTRRATSATQHGQIDVIFAPFLNADVIQAAFSYRKDDLVDNSFHRYLVAQNTPDWANVPYEGWLTRPPEAEKFQNSDWRKSNGYHYYNRRGYWEQVGAKFIEPRLDSSALLGEIFDRDRLKKDWLELADEVALLSLV
jgi:hypothetical protein